MYGSGTSPGVYVREYDASQTVAGVSSSTAVIIGEADRGPVLERTHITNEKDFIAVFGKPNAKKSFSIHAGLGYLEHGTSLYFTRVSTTAKFGGAVVSFDGKFNQTAALDNGLLSTDDYDFGASELFLVVGQNPGEWNNELQIQITPYTNDLTSNTFYITIYQTGSAIPVERKLCSLNYQVDGFGKQMNIESQFENSNYVKIVQNHDFAGLVANPTARIVNTLNAGSSATQLGIKFYGGDTGVAPTKGEMIQAWELYADDEVVDVSILINAGYTDVDLQLKMVEIATERMDCFAILDVPQDMQKHTQAISYRRNELACDSSYAALYSPDILVLDKYNDIRLYIPPSGHVAGAYARTDEEAALWFAPAGLTRGKLDARGVRYEYDKGMRDVLYQAQINVIRVIPGEGINIMGSDTLQVMQSALSNINVRRLMIYLEKSLSRALNYSVFEQNDEILWTRLESLCDTFLNPLKQGRALYWYGVQCDKKNNPPESIANGDVNLDVLVDPALPVKRIHLNTVLNKTGVRITVI